jgi:hypothetical protein
MAKRAFTPPQVPLACDSSLILNPDVPIEEEMIPDYNHKVFYPVNPGDISHDRYKTVAKVGWGTSSTVWLARDLNLYASRSLRFITPLTQSQRAGGRPLCRSEVQQLRLFR